MRLSSPAKLPTLRKPAQRPTGMRIIPKGELIISGPGESPEGFLNGQNSESEWPPYWALGRIFNNPRKEDIRKPPFIGGPPDWSYQVKFTTAYTLSLRSAGDFVVNQGGTTIVVRIQSERYHGFVSSEKHEYDVVQRAQLEAAGMSVVDVLENQYLHDPSGQAVIIAMKQAIGRLEWINPVVAGTAIRASKQKVLG